MCLCRCYIRCQSGIVSNRQLEASYFSSKMKLKGVTQHEHRSRRTYTAEAAGKLRTEQKSVWVICEVYE
jgi:maleate cis-trans isomerase